MAHFSACVLWCCVFFRVLSDWRRVGRRIYRQSEWPPCRKEDFFFFVPIGLLVCPPLYLMFILWLLCVKIRYVICLFVVMSAVTGRTHVNWRYRTLKARRDSTMRCRLGLRPRSLFRISLFALLTQICLFINKLIPSVQVQVINRVCCPRRPPRRLAYQTSFICNLRWLFCATYVRVILSIT